MLSYIHLVTSFIMAHQLGSYMVLISAIGALPMPDDKSSGFYKWFFTFGNALSMNWLRSKKGLQSGGQGTQV